MEDPLNVKKNCRAKTTANAVMSLVKYALTFFRASSNDLSKYL